MIIETIKQFLDGSTKPFLALSNIGKSVVVKALLQPTKGKILFNEFVSGSLANQIGLPWPQTSLATLSPLSIEWLKGQSIHVSSPDCVAMNFIENLVPVPWPKLTEKGPGGKLISHQLSEVNPTYLAKYFADPENQSAFYGRALFELWLFFQDTKYDTLFSLADKTPLFVDGSLALGGSEWDFEELDYAKSKCFPQSPYLEGILTNRELFLGWFSRIESVEKHYIRSIIDAIPASWEIIQPQLDFILELLTAKRRDFLQVWKYELLENPYSGESLLKW